MNEEQKIRRVSTCAPEHECSPEEIDELLEELHKIDEDSEIIHYVSPTIQEMKEIIEKAETYTGTWYHSKVVLSGNKEKPETEELKNKISELGEDHGIALSWDFDGKDTDLIFKALERIEKESCEKIQLD